MKRFALITAAIASVYAAPALSVDLKSALKEPLTKQETTNVSSNALVKYASEQLGLSEDMVGSGIGALLKVAKDHISADNFGLISQAIPDTDAYINNAPKASSKSALSSMLGKNSEKGKKAASLGYLDSAFQSIGIPKEQVPLLVNSLVGYMSNNGYSKEANLLKQGLSFL